VWRSPIGETYRRQPKPHHLHQQSNDDQIIPILALLTWKSRRLRQCASKASGSSMFFSVTSVGSSTWPVNAQKVTLHLLAASWHDSSVP
jgi:hypothetical protein